MVNSSIFSIVLRVLSVNLHESLSCQSRLLFEVWLKYQKVMSVCLSILFTSYSLEEYTEGKACTRCLLEPRSLKIERSIITSQMVNS